MGEDTSRTTEPFPGRKAGARMVPSGKPVPGSKSPRGFDPPAQALRGRPLPLLPAHSRANAIQALSMGLRVHRPPRSRAHRSRRPSRFQRQQRAPRPLRSPSVSATSVWKPGRADFPCSPLLSVLTTIRATLNTGHLSRAINAPRVSVDTHSSWSGAGDGCRLFHSFQADEGIPDARSPHLGRVVD